MAAAGWCLFDLDRTLTRDRTVERLATHFGLEDALQAALSPRGEPNAGIRESGRVMEVFSGLPASEFDAVCAHQILREGAVAAARGLRQRGFRLMVASASYEVAAQAAATALGAEAIAAVRPEVRRGRLTGRLHPSPWRGDCGRWVCKGKVARSLDGPLIAVGDGANDVCMFREADVAIAMEPCHRDAARAADLKLQHLSSLPRVVDALCITA